MMSKCVENCFRLGLLSKECLKLSQIVKVLELFRRCTRMMDCCIDRYMVLEEI